MVRVYFCRNKFLKSLLKPSTDMMLQSEEFPRIRLPLLHWFGPWAAFIVPGRPF